MFHNQKGQAACAGQAILSQAYSLSISFVYQLELNLE